MKNETVTTKEILSSEITSPANGFVSKVQSKNLKKLSPEHLDKILEEINKNLDGGFSFAAEKITQNTLRDFSVDENQRAILIRIIILFIGNDGKIYRIFGSNY